MLPCRPTSYQLNFQSSVGVWFTVVLVLNGRVFHLNFSATKIDQFNTKALLKSPISWQCHKSRFETPLHLSCVPGSPRSSHNITPYCFIVLHLSSLVHSFFHHLFPWCTSLVLQPLLHSTSFPGSLVLPPLGREQKGGKMRDPGNEVVLHDDGTCVMCIIYQKVVAAG